MKVRELIEALQKMPQGADVYHIWDGEPRTEINVVYKDRTGRVMTADTNMVCYSTDARPKGAPTEEENQFWRVSMK